MLYAGIAWTADGYVVEVIDDTGNRTRPAARWGAERVPELTEWLGALGGASGQPCAIVLESTNGLVDGLLTAAGLDVHRADPWVLPPRPAFGSVPAIALAEQARTNLASLSPLTAAGGGQTGRDSDYHGGIQRSAPIEAELTRSGRFFRHGPRDRQEVALTFDDGPDPSSPARYWRSWTAIRCAPPSSASACTSMPSPTRCDASPTPGTASATTPGRTPSCLI